MSPSIQKQFGALMQTASGFRQSRVLTTAVHLDLFSRLHDHSRSLEQLKKPGEDAEALRRLCRALTAMELLKKEGDHYSNTSIANTFLIVNAEYDLRPMLRLMHRSYSMWEKLDEVMLHGQSMEIEQKHTSDQDWSPDFIAAMEARAQLTKSDIMSHLGKHLPAGGQFLDLGGGSGVYSRELLEQTNDTRGTVGDLPHVIEVAEAYAKESPVHKRLNFQSINLLEDEDYGSGYDLVLLSAIIHCFGPEQNKTILQRIHRALKPGGKIAIVDYIMNEDKTDPVNGTLFGINMLLATEAGDVYSEQEVRAWLEETAFKDFQRIELEESADLLIATTP